MTPDILHQINLAKRERRSIAVVTELATGDQRLVLTLDDVSGDQRSCVEPRLTSGKSGIDEIDEKEVFVQVHVPAPRLVIVGAVHISQALVPMAQACAFDVTVIDPRTSFATPERFTNVALHAEWPQDVLGDLSLDPYTAVVAVTHDPKIDDYPIQSALDAGCFYIGALGSRNTHAKRIERLKEAGVGNAELARIHAPIGLDIAAASPAEIAVAVLAQMIGVMRGGAVT